MAELKRRKEIEEQQAAAAQAAQAQALLLNSGNAGEVFDSMQVNFDGEDDFNLADVEDLGQLDEELELELEEEEEEEEEEDEDDFGYEMPIGPLPQMVNNDLKSLDEMVSVFESRLKFYLSLR